MSSDDLRKRIDRISRSTGKGSVSASMQDAMRGINHRGYGSRLPANSDQYGLTFFTRPELNLSYNNIVTERKLHPLATNDRLSINRAIRTMLDPRNEKGDNNIDSPMIDRNSPFINILSNSLISMSGWPDPVLNTYTTNEGRAKEEHAIVDSVIDIRNTFDLTCNFRNIAGDPITRLIHYWNTYSSYVHEGRITPWPDMIIADRMDYTTRIYRLVLDSQRKYVTKIAATGAAFPINDTLGQSFNFNSETPVNTETEQVSVSFKCMGAVILDPVLINDFNATVAKFNRFMATSDMVGTYKDVESGSMKQREAFYHKLTTSEAVSFNGKGYPYINPETMELEWWVPLDEYNTYLNDGGEF